MARLTETLARRALDRAVADRQAEYMQEMQRVVEATYRLIERTGSLDPSLRDILRESALSTQAFYRYFQSKDELLLLLLDDGRRQLLGYLEHRVARATTPDTRLRAWIEGVLAQASNPGAADRTRPFVVNQARLAEAYPVEQQTSVDLLTEQLASILKDRGRARGARREELRRDAEAIYEMVFGTLHRHLLHRTRPTAAEVDHLVRFTVRALSTPDR